MIQKFFFVKLEFNLVKKIGIEKFLKNFGKFLQKYSYN